MMLNSTNLCLLQQEIIVGNIYKQKMYRNTYLQLYKSAASVEQSPTFLLAHFNQIYNTLGCVLQDLQYQIGKLVMQNSKKEQSQVKAKEVQKIQNNSYSRQKEKQKIVVKQLQPLEQQPKKLRTSDREQKIFQNSSKKPYFLEEMIKSQRQDALSLNRLNQMNKKLKIQKPFPSRNSTQKVRNISSDPSIGSFESLLLTGQKANKNNKIDSGAKIVEIKQQNYEMSNSHIDNTYQDILSRIFKDDTGRKSK